MKRICVYITWAIQNAQKIYEKFMYDIIKFKLHLCLLCEF